MLSRIQSASEKLHRIFMSDLSFWHKLLYLLDELTIRLGWEPVNGTRKLVLNDGVTVHLRRGSTDRKVFDEVFLERIYDGFAGQVPTSAAPAVLIDLGANIGLSAIALARSLTPSQIIAVEPDRENFRALRRNLEAAVTACHPIQAFVGPERAFAKVIDSGNGAWGLRMGAPEASSGDMYAVPVLPLHELIPTSAPGTKVIVKCDIEGAESGVFKNILDWDHLVDFVILELHTEFFTARQLRASLECSDFHWQIHGDLTDDGLLAVIALERKSPRASPQRADLKSLAQSNS